MDQATHNKIVSFIWGIADVFRDFVEGALKKVGVKLPVAEPKLILEAVSRRVEDALRVIARVLGFTRHFDKPQPLRTLAEVAAAILAVQKEAEGLLDGLLVAGMHP